MTKRRATYGVYRVIFLYLTRGKRANLEQESSRPETDVAFLAIDSRLRNAEVVQRSDPITQNPVRFSGFFCGTSA
jgi:hypothetical protein